MNTLPPAPFLIAMEEQRIPPALLVIGALVIVAAAIAVIRVVKRQRQR
ncbi:hypothetical protein AB0N17_01395 [Streptomyces sp. NPDC051133]